MSQRHLFLKHWSWAVMTIFLMGIVFAGTDGTIRGRVTDLDGNGLPGAQVYIPELAIGAVADVDGNYLILNVPVGTYNVTVMMLGYQKQTISNVRVMMDETVWLNFKLPIAAIEGEEVEVVAQRPMVEKGVTSKKITVSKEAIESLPIRDLNELYTLQSGVVRVESRTQGIPDYEERGLEEVHVRGGRTGEIAYLIDGMYIRNPIYGGIGNGTRLNLFAVKEFDWQPGGFNAEYGDAMSAVSNMHTYSGGDAFSYHMKYETSSVGAALGSRYDELRAYNDFNIGFGGSLFGSKKLYYWLSGQLTDNGHYRVYKFDDIVYKRLPGQVNFYDVPDFNDPNYQTILDQNRNNLVQPWDQVPGFRGFGFDRTWDVFTKLTYKFSNKLRMSLAYWQVAAHRKGFNPRYLYWDVGQGELFRDTRRYALEINQSLTSKTFYTFRYSRFIQDQFQGVRWRDSDKDGYPDWFEWRHPAGPNTSVSDAYNPYIIPYSITENGDTIHYTQLDQRSGWYYGAEPGIYNWEVAEEFTDLNGNGIWDVGEPWIDKEGPEYTDGQWDGPELVETLQFRDGSYWLAPEMYEDYEPFYDYRVVDFIWELDPAMGQFAFSRGTRYSGEEFDPYYYMPTYYNDAWKEDRAFGGHDRYYASSRAVTNEFRFDITSQVTDKLKLRTGIDYKSHKLNFYEVKYPWLGEGAFIQTFAEYWQDTGPDGLLPFDQEYEGPDYGEGNGRWDPGEAYADANKNGKWDDYREPEELAGYIQTTFEVPWMVINAGIRMDAVNYNTQVWADTNGNFSPGKPWYYSDMNGNNQWDPDEEVSEFAGLAQQKVLFTDSKWTYKLSPRLGFSHVITDKATFTFNYGLYYQTPVYQNVYLNTNRLEDPEQLFEEGEGLIGNATMNSMRTQSYSFAFNVQVGQYWRYSVGAWVKNMDQWVTYKNSRSGVYQYKVFSNGDYGSARGIDLTLENRGHLLNTLIQYTYSIAKGNSEYDWAAAEGLYVDAPSQEYRMPYDRPHDLTVSIYSHLPYGIVAGFTGFYQSGYPYTPWIFNGRDPVEDVKNKNSKRAPAYKNVNIAISKAFTYYGQKISLGLNVFNVFNIMNAIDIWPLTGKPDDPGQYYLDYVGLPGTDPNHQGVRADKSGSFYDQPWKFSHPREINFFVRLDFE